MSRRAYVFRIVSCSLFITIASGLSLCESDRETKAAEFVIDGRTFTLVDGFTIDKVAGPPLVDRPICADFDAAGNLYVAEASGTNDNVQTQLANKPHRILKLQDRDGDGKFEHRQIFADKMMFPEGALWHDGSLYVAAPPAIWKLTDTTGDGIADQREEWFDAKTLTGCANDLHGPYLGPDGWIYWCKGAFAEQKHLQDDGSTLSSRAAHIFRRRPEGGNVEVVMTGGMDNPVELVFTPGGERIFTTTFLQHPAEAKRDGLIHAIYGGVYGKDHGVLEGHPRTGELMPPMVHMGAAAPCGLLRRESSSWGVDYQDNLFACSFNLHKVTRHVLVKQGATFRSQDSDFLECDDLDFHPTDVIEDADGSMLIIDTGGWYKLCCPTSQLHKPDVFGGIYRIRKTDAAPTPDPRGQDIAWERATIERLLDYCQDKRVAVQDQAIAMIANRPDNIYQLAVLMHHENAELRLKAVWALSQINSVNARAANRKALRDENEIVRQAAAHSASVWRDEHATSTLSELLTSDSAHNRRVAAEALGRIGNGDAIPDLLFAAGDCDDRVLEHSMTYALIQIAQPELTQAGLASSDAKIRRTALIAIDQMPGGELRSSEIKDDLLSTDATLRTTAGWLVRQNPDWAASLCNIYGTILKNGPLDEENRHAISDQLTSLVGSAEIQAFIGSIVLDEQTSLVNRQMLLSVMAQSGVSDLPVVWQTSLASLLSNPGKLDLSSVVATVAQLPTPKEQVETWTDSLLKIASQSQSKDLVRLQALAALPNQQVATDGATFQFLLSQLDDTDSETRSLAFRTLQRLKNNQSQLIQLTGLATNLGPLEISPFLDIYASSTDATVGEALVEGLLKSQATAAIPVASLKSKLQQFGESLQESANRVYQKMDAERFDRAARLEAMLAELKDGDIRRGQRIFHSNRAACSACHAMGYLGGRIGPDLTRIGKTRTERDLLEAIVFPSESFVRSYEPYTILTESGTTHSGILKNETATEIVLVNIDRNEIRIPVSEIESRRPSKVSVMPAGLDQQLSTQDLADLVKFLKSLQ